MLPAVLVAALLFPHSDCLLPPSGADQYIVQSGRLGFHVSREGAVTSVAVNHTKIPLRADSYIDGGKPLAPPVVRSSAGRITISRAIKLGGTTCAIVDVLTPDADAIRWDMEIRASGPTTTAPITTELRWPITSPARFWAAWNDPLGSKTGVWHDPLESQRFSQRTWSYGETPEGDWMTGDLVTLPMFSVIPTMGSGVTFLQSPADPLVEAKVETTPDGTARFIRSHIRLGAGNVVRFRSYIVIHEPDWRAGLNWLAKHFTAWFDPPLPSAMAFEGGAAYSGDERSLSLGEVERLMQMDFRTLWKLSDDYAYMGMFIPPTKNPKLVWERTPDSGSPADYKPLWTDAKRLDDFARMLKSHGFHLLDYFNACEFGVDMARFSADAPSQSPDLWKNPHAFLQANFPQAPMLDTSGRPVGAWQGGWLLDPGDVKYRDYLLSQAHLYLDRVPYADGICIDRADYIRLHNARGDDGMSWYGGPARSLVFSWQRLLAPLAAMMHAKRKAVFSNLMDPRLDLARDLDGLYCEFGDQPTVANGASLMCIRKPLLLWTRDENTLNDSFFQRELYLGAFPTIPYPTNNHCIQPSPDRDHWFIVYGPLFEALTGRQWVLDPGCIQTDGVAKVNLFRVPNGFAAVVAFAGAATSVRIRVDTTGLTACRAISVLRPGRLPYTLRAEHRSGNRILLDVPTSRGCAVVVFRL